jgi:hypothetical protein
MPLGVALFLCAAFGVERGARGGFHAEIENKLQKPVTKSEL